MIPLYFPYTFISQPVADMLTFCFEKIALYHATGKDLPEYLNPLIENNKIVVRTPVTGDEKKFESIIKDYRFMGNQNHIHKTYINETPYFNDSSAYQIKSDINNNIDKMNHQTTDKTENEQKIEQLNAKLFLQLAHEYDQENFEIENQLTDFQKKESEIFETLKGIDGNISNNTSIKNHNLHLDSDIKNMENRLSSWLQLFYQDTTEHSVFITINKFVINYLSTCSEELELIHETDKFSFVTGEHENKRNIQNYLKETMNHLINGKKYDGSLNHSKNKDLNKISSKFYRIREESVHDLFSKCIANKFFIHEKMKKNNNLLFVLID